MKNQKKIMNHINLTNKHINKPTTPKQLKQEKKYKFNNKYTV